MPKLTAGIMCPICRQPVLIGNVKKSVSEIAKENDMKVISIDGEESLVCKSCFKQVFQGKGKIETAKKCGSGLHLRSGKKNGLLKYGRNYLVIEIS